MDKAIFDQIELLQKFHWYHVATKKFIQDYITSKIDLWNVWNWLDVGCGGGGMITSTRIQPRGLRVGLERSMLAKPHWKGGFDPVWGDAQEIPFANDSFQLITAIDLVEHLEDDYLGLSEMNRVLAPGGSFIMIVPCHQALWSTVDVQLGHFRRYAPRQIVDPVSQIFNGADIVHVRYLNNMMFFPVFVLRRLQRVGILKMVDKEIGSASMPPAWLNMILLKAFQIELRYFSPIAPIGIGLFMHIRKPPAHLHGYTDFYTKEPIRRRSCFANNNLLRDKSIKELGRVLQEGWQTYQEYLCEIQESTISLTTDNSSLSQIRASCSI